jgi:hypothetical protein
MSADDIPSVSITNKCIVLDLDLTLVCTQDNTESIKDFKILTDPSLLALRRRTYYSVIDDLNAPGTGTKFDYWGITRPHLNEFLLFCFSYFRIVAVWSAGQRAYVEGIVDHIFKDIRPPHVVFTHDDVIEEPDRIIIKPLEKMFNSNPILQKYMNFENTLALDDNISTFRDNPDNGILIPPYEPAPSINAMSRDDPALLQLKAWLLQPEVADSPDVRTLDKSLIFKTPLSSYRNSNSPKPRYSFTKSNLYNSLTQPVY